ncbi:hypothetical protein ITI46_21865 [Streptomyces oryzae]|uniref:Uncharacterized protein n=1 Tax=Streptomyces oryzae TaxID=1434886 RepID=A0ABS3XGP2_9ACTN|nr:hypothetical protein [Streptomyces oryzae]MBO8194286.1 hypothetical protein [Streptomyces oryzae]
MEEHLAAARKFAKQAEDLVEGLSEPGQKATVCALLAIAHGVLEVGYDLESVKSAIQQS